MRSFALSALFALMLVACAPASHTSNDAGPSTPPETTAPASEGTGIGCPPMNATEMLRSAIENSLPTSDEVVSQIDVSDMKVFCTRAPEAILCAGRPGRLLTLAEVQREDAALRSLFEYRGDYTRTGSWDLWRNDVICGDCEDYALTLSERLGLAGASGASMGLVIWSPGPGAAHATLVIETSDAGLIEVGVGPGETPTAYDENLGHRFAVMQLDGKQRWTQRPGVSIVDQGEHIP